VSFIQPNILIAAVFAYTWFVGGKMDAKDSGRPNHGPYWALASIIISALLIKFLGAGVLLVIGGQVLLFVGITLWRVTFEK
jgi:hypothetical protein